MAAIRRWEMTGKRLHKSSNRKRPAFKRWMTGVNIKTEYPLGRAGGFFQNRALLAQTSPQYGAGGDAGTYASELALIDAGLLDDPCLTNGQTGVSYGSSSGSFDGLIDFTKMLLNHDKGGMNATSYIRMMGHTCPVNISLHFGINGALFQLPALVPPAAWVLVMPMKQLDMGYRLPW